MKVLIRQLKFRNVNLKFRINKIKMFSKKNLNFQMYKFMYI